MLSQGFRVEEGKIRVTREIVDQVWDVCISQDSPPNCDNALIDVSLHLISFRHNMDICLS